MRRSTIFTVLGLVLIVVGAVGGFFYWNTTYATSAVDNQLQNQAVQVEQAWQEEATTEEESATPAPTTTEEVKQREPDQFEEGDVIGVLKVPAWGEDHSVPIIHGVGDDDLERGVGHYPDSGTPGKLGNFAMAGHRSGDPQPFRNLLELNEGDKIIVETKLATYTYVVTSSARDTTLVAQDGGWVIHSPKIDEAHTKSTITLTTCTHLYRSDDRSVLFGELERMQLKS